MNESHHRFPILRNEKALCRKLRVTSASSSISVPLDCASSSDVTCKIRPNDPWTPEDLIRAFPNLSLVIDLTNTDRYYNSFELTDLSKSGLKYAKIHTKGHEVPDKSVIRRFAYEVDRALQDNPDALIGVHCTHGVNRTGYLICRYLIENLKWQSKHAIAEFARCRGHPIERPNYLRDLEHGRWKQNARTNERSLPRSDRRDQPVTSYQPSTFPEYPAHPSSSIVHHQFPYHYNDYNPYYNYSSHYDARSASLSVYQNTDYQTRFYQNETSPRSLSRLERSNQPASYKPYPTFSEYPPHPSSSFFHHQFPFPYYDRKPYYDYYHYSSYYDSRNGSQATASSSYQDTDHRRNYQNEIPRNHSQIPRRIRKQRWDC